MVSMSELTLGCEVKHTNLIYSKASSAYFKNGTLFVNFQWSGETSLWSNQYKTILCMFRIEKLNQHYAHPRRHYSACSENKPCVDVLGDNLAQLTEEGTSLAVTTQEGKIVAFVGTITGHLIQIKLDIYYGTSQLVHKRSLLQYTRNETQDPAIKRSITFDSDGNNLYLIIGKTVLKYPVHLCSQYNEPQSCLLSPLKCVWCNGGCQFKDTEYGCIGEGNAKAFIKLVSPRSGPLQGGTLINIQGGFGNHEIENLKHQIMFRIGGKICTPQRWLVPSGPMYKWSVDCETPQAERDYTYQVVLDIYHKFLNNKLETVKSNETFSYREPKLFCVSPGFGPAAGGTNVTLFGEHLNIGRNQTITLSGRKCSINGTNDTQMSCLSGPSSTLSNLSGSITLNIDGHPVKPDCASGTRFFYKKNPLILRVDRNRTIFSGRMNLTVYGTHLDSIANPQLVVSFVKRQKKMRLIENCVHGEKPSDIMVCPVPSMDPIMSKPTVTSPIKTRLTFKMDGMTPENLSLDPKNVDFDFLYYPNPYFSVFKNDLSENDLLYDIIVQGSNLKAALEPNDIRIMIDGTESCDVSEMADSYLRCHFHKQAISRLKRDTPTLYTVKASVGHLNYKLGQVLISESNQTTNTWVVVITCVAVPGLLAIVAYKVLKKKGYFEKKNEVSVQYDPGQQVQVTFSRVIVEVNKKNEITTNVCNFSPNITEDTMEKLRAENMIFPAEYLSLVRPVGKGAFGCVYKSWLQIPNQPPQSVAVKTILRRSTLSGVVSQEEVFLKEGILMKKFCHPNVLSVLGVSFDVHQSPQIILPLMELGDLQTILRDPNNELQLRTLLSFGIQIAEGMEYLASLKYVHRDLATRNCTLDRNMLVKVGDFGLSRDINDRAYYVSADTNTKLPIRWMAPESIADRKYSELSDVWSFGVVLWELMTKADFPYKDIMSNKEVMNKVCQGLKLDKPDVCPLILYGIMLDCWERKPKTRPRFQELVVKIKDVQRKCLAHKLTNGSSEGYENVITMWEN